jgi:hypothetical protein
MKAIALISLLVTLVFLFGCEDENPYHQTQRVFVSFKVKELRSDEGDGYVPVQIVFSKPAPYTGKITLESNIDLDNILTSQDIVSSRKVVINVSEGERESTTLLRPVDDTILNGTKLIVLKFHSASDGFLLTMNDSMVLTIADDDITGEQQRVINFSGVDQVISESKNPTTTVRLFLDEPLKTEGSVSLTANSATPGFESHFRTIPALAQGKINLVAPAGSREISFQVIANDNNVVQGDIQLAFDITGTSENIKKGVLSSQILRIKDDELFGKLKAYEVTDGHDIQKQSFEYDALGRISKLYWQSYTPHLREGTHHYIYDNSGRLIRIDKDGQRSVLFHYQNGRVVKTEVVVYDYVKEYANLAYDAKGNISGVEHFVREHDGAYRHTMTHVYLYFLDGNIYKKLSYSVDPHTRELTLIATHTYDQYSSAPIPVPMVEIIPQVKSQLTSPRTYRHQTLTHDLLYELSYEFNAEGLIEKRIAQSAGLYQTAVYLYY